MEKVKEAWVVATQKESVPNLTAGARKLADRVVLYLVGEGPVSGDADAAYSLVVPANAPAGACAAELAAKAADERPALIVVESTADGRMIAAALAVACDAGIASDVTALSVSDGAVHAERMVYGGSAIQVEKAAGITIATAPAGLFEAEVGAPLDTFEQIVCTAPTGLEVTSREEKAAVAVDLSQEAYVVGVGRGMGSADGAPAVREFAAAIGAGIGCSRPVGEDLKWFGESGYLGISGSAIKPQVYIACGISGQVQHMVGVSRSGQIFAINKEPKAPIFEECDYGIVADMNELIPVLTQKFQQA